MSHSNLPFFLRLPYKARRQIYLELGLLLDYDVIPKYNVGGEWSSKSKTFYDAAASADFDDLIPNQLFFVSRAVSEDVRSFFYGENTICFDNDPQDPSLSILMHLSPEVMRALQSVSISYFIESESRSGNMESGSLKGNSGLSQVNESFDNWIKACEWIAKNIKIDDQLTLQLNCDATTKMTAAVFLEPLHKLPRLKHLSIGLGFHSNPDVQRTIMTTIWQKTRFHLYYPPSIAPFRFFDLPVELQLHILYLAGLIAFEERFFYVHNLNRFASMSCLNTMRASAENEIDYYCPATRTSFSTVTSCWRSPHIPFLVSNTMRQLVTPIFYSRNRFEILYRPDFSPPCAQWSVQKSTFLRGFPPYAFQFLRNICWDFFHKEGFVTIHPTDQATQDWIKSLEYISQAVPASVLTMELYLSRCLEDTVNNEAINLESFDWVVRPMTCLRGLLGDLFIHIALGEQYQPGVQIAKEQSLEKSVMGDDYDSLARGKWSSSRTEDSEHSEDSED